ncbi:ABC transporter permease [Acidiferrimicrobium sp. IK]|uniref:MlaE family ABC transporter permease n=1 Tax=Acidiferrimicrobium sp. IK TaxID=2871700 RepID=UPI0021CB3774|nr:ABC transporter permease [Acidiferrimicrobium sp. IK]MCU4184187.1 ABC transporter permease [Acidiferrimicrobium sp. IK]
MTVSPPLLPIPSPGERRSERTRLVLARLRAPRTAVSDQVQWFGALLFFLYQVARSVPTVARRHRQEVYRQLADVTFGGRVLAVAASTVLVVFVLSAFLGIEVGLEGYQGLEIIGLAPLSGLIAAYGDTRELIPLITGFGLASQMGCKFTAQLGAMRISDEVDALDVMAVPSLPYLVTTRILAGLMAVIPLYLVALSGSYFATQLTVSLVAHEGTGTYQHYFHAFLQPIDIVDSVLKVVVFAVIIIIIHCYYGYTTKGGPEEVGTATGRAIRASIVALALSDLLLTMFFYGLSTSAIKLTG